MPDLKELQKQLDQIVAQIEAAEMRLGAHSIKPVLMQELLDLEEKRDALLDSIRLLRNRSIEGPS